MTLALVGFLACNGFRSRNTPLGQVRTLDVEQASAKELQEPLARALRFRPVVDLVHEHVLDSAGIRHREHGALNALH